MKKSILFLFSAAVTLGLFAQHAPVAVDDYFSIPIGDTVVLNLIKNDYHPDSIPFRIAFTSNHHFTDSTITIITTYDYYWNVTENDTLIIDYTLKDIHGNSGSESSGKVYITFQNKPVAWLDINNVKARVISAGLQFYSGGSPIISNYSSHIGYFFPKESGKSPLFCTNLWIVGTDENDSLHVAAERYRQIGIDFKPGPVSIVNGEVLANDSVTVAWNRVWKLTKDEIIYHKFHYADPGYQPIEAIATWPAHGDSLLGQASYLAPFVDVDGDGVYNPLNGDYPLIRGDQCIFFIINDVQNHTETKGKPFGIEIHVMAYEFYNPDTLALNNTVFYSYKIFNRSQNKYYNTKIGFFTDFDIGYAFDDYLGSDVQRGLIYAYNSDSIDDPVPDSSNYNGPVPAQTAMILSGPSMDADGEDNPAGQCDAGINGTGFGDGIVDNERYGMTRTIYTSNTNPNFGDPDDAKEYADYMNGLWKDGSAIEYGGTGHVSGGAYGPAAHFVFPGTTDPCNWGTGGEAPYGPVDWTMKDSELNPTDVRGVAISGDFTFNPGDMQRFDVAFVSAFAEEGKTALETVLDYSDIVKSKYLKDPDHFGYQYLGIHETPKTGGYNRLPVWPNPVTGKVSFTYKGKSKFAVYTIRNVSGEKIASGRVENNQTVVTDMANQPKGLYIIRVTSHHDVYVAKIINR